MTVAFRLRGTRYALSLSQNGYAMASLEFIPIGEFIPFPHTERMAPGTRTTFTPIPTPMTSNTTLRPMVRLRSSGTRTLSRCLQVATLILMSGLSCSAMQVPVLLARLLNTTTDLQCGIQNTPSGTQLGWGRNGTLWVNFRRQLRDTA